MSVKHNLKITADQFIPLMQGKRSLISERMIEELLKEMLCTFRSGRTENIQDDPVQCLSHTLQPICKEKDMQCLA